MSENYSTDISRNYIWLALAGWLGVCYLVSGVAGFFTARQIPTWYASIAQPSFTPPNWVFAPVWTTLYTLMGIAAWLVWRLPDSPNRTWALDMFWLQLALNFAWSFLFFDRHWILTAAIEVVALWAAILAMTIAYARVNRVAMWMMVPYLAWVSFASVLNWGVWWVNR